MYLLIISKLRYAGLPLSSIYPRIMELFNAIANSLQNYADTTENTFFGGIFNSRQELMKRPRNPQETRIEICLTGGYDYYVIYIMPGVDTDSDEMDAAQGDVIDCLPVNIDQDGWIDQDTRVLGIRVPQEESEDEE